MFTFFIDLVVCFGWMYDYFQIFMIWFLDEIFFWVLIEHNHDENNYGFMSKAKATTVFAS
jgi:hypothetical protein